MNSVISRIYLVPCASSMLFDDGEVNCSPYSSWIYKQTITWKWTGSLKILQYQYPYLDPYTKQLKRSLRFCMRPILQNRKIGKKVGKLLWFAKFAKVFSPPKFFTVRYMTLRLKEYHLLIYLAFFIVKRFFVLQQSYQICKDNRFK